MWDVFISHAWEDKETVARPLARELSKAGINVWYDESTLTLGDSLRRSIDAGLDESRYGLVILSPDFFTKGWTQRELDRLTAREIGPGTVILPILHRLTPTEVAHFSPTLAGKVSVSTVAGLDIVVQAILNVVRPEITPAPLEIPHQPQGDRPKSVPKSPSSVSRPVQFPLRRFVLPVHHPPYVLAIVFLFTIIISIGILTDAGGRQANNPQHTGSERSSYSSGLLNMQEGRYERAINDFSKVIMINPNNTKAYYNRGVCYMKIEECEKAISDFTEVINREPKNSDAYYNRAGCYKKTGKNDKAVDDYKMHGELSKGTGSRQR
jgi:hypothetical protein